MDHLEVVRQFVAEANKALTLDDLRDMLGSAVERLKIDYFALLHHVDLTAPPSGGVRMENYPSLWTEQIIEQRYFVDDPVLQAATSSAAGFLWSDLPQLVNLSRRQKTILEAASREGLREGFTVPVHVPGEFSGSCSFGVKSNRSFDERVIPVLQSIAPFAFEAARRVMKRTGAQAQPSITSKLTTRQIDCVILIAQGKSDWECGQILGISAETVHKHIESAKQKLSVSTRTQLVVRTLFENQISFHDALGQAITLNRG